MKLHLYAILLLTVLINVEAGICPFEKLSGVPSGKASKELSLRDRVAEAETLIKEIKTFEGISPNNVIEPLAELVRRNIFNGSENSLMLQDFLKKTVAHIKSKGNPLTPEDAALLQRILSYGNGEMPGKDFKSLVVDVLEAQKVLAKPVRDLKSLDDPMANFLYGDVGFPKPNKTKQDPTFILDNAKQLPVEEKLRINSEMRSWLSIMKKAKDPLSTPVHERVTNPLEDAINKRIHQPDSDSQAACVFVHAVLKQIVVEPKWNENTVRVLESCEKFLRGDITADQWKVAVSPYLKLIDTKFLVPSKVGL